MRIPIKYYFTVLLLAAMLGNVMAADKLDELLPVRGFCISAPSANKLDDFIQFINDVLAPHSINTLILRVDYNYQFTSHPELRDQSALSKADVGRLVEACRKNKIRVIPQINLLGHQSWAKSCGNLLKVYPEFDETPWVAFPEKYAWPNPDGLYCKSYCPLHPKVHEVVFALVDEICDAFETDAFHAGMDEVFYIGEDKCPRCGGKDKAELFAGEVKTIRDHLQQKGRTLWIWGDRLLDGKTTGMGEWEASMNGTAKAIDLVPKDIVICDWHYDRPDQSAVYFAMKGLKVVTCPWKNSKSAVLQVQDMVKFRDHSSKKMKDNFQGMVQTVWSGVDSFLKEMAEAQKPDGKGGDNQAKCFLTMSEEIAKLASTTNAAATNPAN